MNNRKKAYTEVYKILQKLNEEEYNKIPPEIIKSIKINRDEKYNYELDSTLTLKEQTMLPETKAILFNKFRDYLATTEQKTKIIRKQKKKRLENELRKQKIYNSDIFANKQKDNVVQNNPTNKSMQTIQKEENILKKIINKIRTLFMKK